MSNQYFMLLFDASGNRKYVTAEERNRFAAACKNSSRDVRSFGCMLLYTGCRISEGLSIRAKDIDLSAKTVTIGSLKKRRKGVYRQVPLSDQFINDLELVFDLRQLKEKAREQPLWNWSRSTASRRIREVMQLANIKGIQACAKGLRHGFAIHALEKHVPLNMVSKWLGHSSLEVTAIYTNASGREERNIASALWEEG